MEEFFLSLITGTGPFMGAAAFMAGVQYFIIKRIHEKDLRISLMRWSVFFQMAALFAGMILPYMWQNGWR